MKPAVLLLLALALVLAVILIGAISARTRLEGFMTYPYLDLWDTYDAGDRGTFYGLMECREKAAQERGPSYRMRPPAFRGRVVP